VGLEVDPDGEHPNCANTFSCGTGILPVKGKGRAGCPPHKKLLLQKGDAPIRMLPTRNYAFFSESKVQEFHNWLQNFTLSG
jgi:hypothetical protein